MPLNSKGIGIRCAVHTRRCSRLIPPLILSNPTVSASPSSTRLTWRGWIRTRWPVTAPRCRMRRSAIACLSSAELTNKWGRRNTRGQSSQTDLFVNQPVSKQWPLNEKATRLRNTSSRQALSVKLAAMSRIGCRRSLMSITSAIAFKLKRFEALSRTS